jgi:hypothetical protein
MGTIAATAYFVQDAVGPHSQARTLLRTESDALHPVPLGASGWRNGTSGRRVGCAAGGVADRPHWEGRLSSRQAPGTPAPRGLRCFAQQPLVERQFGNGSFEAPVLRSNRRGGDIIPPASPASFSGQRQWRPSTACRDPAADPLQP